MPEGPGASRSASSASDGASWSGSAGSPQCPGPRRGAARASVPQKLAEVLSSQYGLNVFVAGLLFLLAWAVHASGVGKRDLLCLLTALMLLQLLWMLWYVGRSYAQRRLIRPKDTHAGARWLRGECGPHFFPKAFSASERLDLPSCLPALLKPGCSLPHIVGATLTQICSQPRPLKALVLLTPLWRPGSLSRW